MVYHPQIKNIFFLFLTKYGGNNTISKLGELQGHPRTVGAFSSQCHKNIFYFCVNIYLCQKYTILGQFAAKFISIPPHF